jgi:hypothetical protein
VDVGKNQTLILSKVIMGKLVIYGHDDWLSVNVGDFHGDGTPKEATS